MIPVAPGGHMPFVSDIQKYRNYKKRTLVKVPNKLSKLSVKPRSIDFTKYPAFLRPKLSPPSTDDKQGESSIFDALSRLKHSLFSGRSKKPHVSRFNSPPRPSPNELVQKEPVPITALVRRGGAHRRLFNVCDDCSRRCAKLEVIMEEECEDDGLPNPAEQSFQRDPHSCSKDLIPRRPRELHRFHGQTLSA